MPAAHRTPSPCALSIAGLDPSGGAGLAADLRGFAAAGVWGCAAAAVLTVQSTAGLLASSAVDRRLLEAQIRELFANQSIRAVKIGALGSQSNVRAVARLLESLAGSGAPSRRAIPVVLDPVLVPSRGARTAAFGARPAAWGARAATRSGAPPRLLDGGALGAQRRLASRVTLVTPNRDEAEVLLGRPVRNTSDAAEAARALVGRGARAALVKGGHLPGSEAIDVLHIGGQTIPIAAPRISRVDVHGTGCLLASLVAGRLAARPHPDLSDRDIIEAVRWAKKRLTRALGRATAIGRGSRVIGYEPLVVRGVSR